MDGECHQNAYNASAFLSAVMLSQIMACGWLSLRQRNIRNRRRFWVRPIWLDRTTHGAASSLIPSLRALDKEYFFDFLRMTPEQFDAILRKVSPAIRHKDTHWRTAISPHDRLALTIRFLASGETIRSLSFTFRMGRATVSKIISETCSAIWDQLSLIYVPFPKTAEEWKKIADGFEDRWQFPHCLGAMDGKHVVIECPINTGSHNFNYKSSFSKVLLAVCDAQYKFIMVDIGNTGSESDGGIFLRSKFGQGLQMNTFKLPSPKPLEGCGNMPYVFVGDEAFPLTGYMMRPYPRKNKNLTHEQRVFNYRISRARRIIENAFGIFSSRWRIFRRPFKLGEDNIDKVVKAAVCLHNFLMVHNNEFGHYCPPGFVDSEDWQGRVTLGEWRKEAEDVRGLADATRLGANTSSRFAMSIRDKLSYYFCHSGKVEWQNRIVYQS